MQPTAKHKLNAAYWNGTLLAAGVIGGIAGSWPVFLVALSGLVISNYCAGYLRR